MMKITVKKLNGSFEIEAEPHDTVGDLKKKIETAEGAQKYPAERQMLIHGVKVLKDETTLQENNVNDNGFVLVLSPINIFCGETGGGGPIPVSFSLSPQDDVGEMMARLSIYTQTHPSDLYSEWHNFLYDNHRSYYEMIRNVDVIADDVMYEYEGKSYFVENFKVSYGEKEELARVWHSWLKNNYPLNYKIVDGTRVEIDVFMIEGREEMWAISRLESLGKLEKSFVKQVYLACDKNEKLARGYIIDYIDAMS